MNRFEMMRQNFRAMPDFLRFLTIFAIVTGIFSPLAFYYYSGLVLDGPYGQFVIDGTRFLLLPFGATLFWCAYLFLTKSHFARQLYLGTWSIWLFFMCLFSFLNTRPGKAFFSSSFWGTIGFSFSIITLIAWYLFCKHSVIAYFLPLGSKQLTCQKKELRAP